MTNVEVQIATRVSKTTGDRLAELAKRNERSVAAELRIALERHLANPGGVAQFRREVEA